MSNRLEFHSPGEALDSPLAGKRLDGDVDADRAWAAIVAKASETYRRTDGHAFRFARSKLSRDRVFRHVLEQGLIEPGATLLDMGCGQGLLASLLCAAGDAARAGRWPAAWAAPPLGAKVVGFDVRPLDLRRASLANREAKFILGDMRQAAWPPCDVAVFFDTLHYLAIDEQDEVLRRVRRSLRPRGAMLLRVGDKSKPLRYGFGLGADGAARLLHGGGIGRLHGRTLSAWVAALESLGLEVSARAMNGRPPFANQLLVARLPRGA